MEQLPTRARPLLINRRPRPGVYLCFYIGLGVGRKETPQTVERY